MPLEQKYGAEQIKVLEGLEGVRKRPAMYIGDTSKSGLHHLFFEVVDNSIDECLAGFCNVIEIIINKDGSGTVKDNGRGIPVDKHPIYKKSAMELALTKLHAGGKFEKTAYEISGGLHGVGVSVVNALSKKMIARVKRDGQIYQQEYKIGKPVYAVKIVGKCKKEEHGTEIIFWPDESIFSTPEFDFNLLGKRFQEIAFLNPNAKIILIDERSGKKEIFHYGGGLIEFVKHINKAKQALHKPIYFKKEMNGCITEVAIQYTEGYNENIFGFVNTINTTEGGTHISGFKTALTRALNDYAKRKGVLKTGSLSGDDVREGLTAIINLKLQNPQFEGQTKTKLGNSEVKGYVDSMVCAALGEFLEENPGIANKIAQKASAALKARDAAKKARDLVRRKNITGFSGLPGKLADCSSKKMEKTELYIVEGDSAGGSAKMARDKEFQAILPLKGKILNVEKAAPVKTLSSDEIINLITAVGTGVKEDFNLKKLRYSKIIIMCDADSVIPNTPMLMFNEKGDITQNYIGEFVDNCISPQKYKVSSLSIDSGKHKIKSIVNVVKHPLKTSLYKVRTSLGYNVTVTPYHSLFLYEGGKILTKATKDIRKGDYVLLPKKLPRNDRDIEIDLIDEAKEYPIYARFEKNELSELSDEYYVDLSKEKWNKLKEIRMFKKISRKKMGDLLGIYYTILEQWELKIDNVMPKFKDFKKYLFILNLDIKDIECSLFIPIKLIDNKKLKRKVFFFRNHTFRIPLELNLTNELAYVLGWYLGDGCCSKGKKNPYRFSLCIGKDKVFYLERIKRAIKESLGCNVILEKRKIDNIIHFNSLSFYLLLNKLGLFKKRASEKFIPDVIYNAKKNRQLNLLKGLLESDGSIVVSKGKAVLCHTTSSKRLAEGIVFLYRQLEMLPSFNVDKSKEHYYKGKLIKSNYLRYQVTLGSIMQLKKADEIWKSHKNSFKLRDFISKAKKMYDRRAVVNVNKDFQAVRVLDIEKDKNKSKYVYDISVDLNRSFIGGVGGLTLHNTDGEHITTLLLTFFFRYAPELIENGNIYIAVSPLYRVRKGKDYYVYSDDELKKLLSKLGGKADVQRFKGLGEMNPSQLWDTTMNPKTRILKKVNIEDAVLADETFSMLMGDVVGPRRKFIETNANIAEVDI